MSSQRPTNGALLLALAGLVALVTPTQAVSWVFSEAKAIAISRVDPIVDPGDVAGHAHNIVGGSRFASELLCLCFHDARALQRFQSLQCADCSAGDYNPDDLRASKCSSVGVQADKSNYWAP